MSGCTEAHFAVFNEICCTVNVLKFQTLSSSEMLVFNLDPVQDPRFVGPDLGPNCLQRLSADDKSHP